MIWKLYTVYLKKKIIQLWFAKRFLSLAMTNLKNFQSIIWNFILENIKEVFSKQASVKYVSMQFYQSTGKYRLFFLISGFCAEFEKFEKSMHSINEHADLLTNI